MDENLITTAINNKTTLTFIYSDKLRVVEPHTLGVTKTDKVQMRAFQINDEIGWRLFDLAKIQPATFSEPREGYKTGDSAFTTILGEIPLA